MVFCNVYDTDALGAQKVTILILIDGFLQLPNGYSEPYHKYVTILILIDGFLQLQVIYKMCCV